MLTIEALSCSGAGHIQTVSLNIPLQATDGISRCTSPTTHKPGNKLSSDRLKGEVFGSKHASLNCLVKCWGLNPGLHTYWIITILMHILPEPGCYVSFSFILCVWVFCLHVCLCTMCMPGAYEGQKRASDALELELQTACNLPGGC